MLVKSLVRFALILALSVCSSSSWAQVDAGGAPAQDAGSSLPLSPAAWKLSQKVKPGDATVAALVAEFTRDGGAEAAANGEAALSVNEAEAIFTDSRAEQIYGLKTVSIVAPSMAARHRKEHVDLLKLFLQPERLNAGVSFFEKHEAILKAAEEKHGVDRHVIVSILSWETKFGTVTGDFSILNVFLSQIFFIEDADRVALSDPKELKLLEPEPHAKKVATIRERAKKNLIALVRQCKAKGIDPFSVKGSWAGAIGFPQFMPASLRWADDGNADGNIDLFTFPDAMFSIGRYLKEHGFSQSREKAVWGYNHEEAYVQGVLAYADALRKQIQDKRDVPPKPKSAPTKK